MDSLTEDSLNSKGLKFPGKGKTEKSINIAESYTECRKKAGPITCTIATGAKEVTNHVVLIAGNTVIATGLASSKLGIGLPLIVSGVGINKSAKLVSNEICKSVIKTGHDYTQCRKNNNPITCGLAISSEKIFNTITNNPRVGKFVRDDIINFADLTHKTWITPNGPRDKIYNFANATKTGFDELKGVRVNSEPSTLKIPDCELTYLFEKQKIYSKYGKEYSFSCLIDEQYLKEILNFFDNDIYNFKMTFTNDEDDSLREIKNNTMIIETTFEPNELRSTKMGRFMYEADLVLKQLLGSSKKINDNLAELYEETGKIHSFCAFFDLNPYDAKLIGKQIFMTNRNIKCVFHSYEIDPNIISNSNKKIIELIEQRNQFMKEYENTLNTTYNILKTRFSGEKKPLYELEEICKALTVALIIKANNCEYNLDEIKPYAKIPKHTAMNIKYAVKIPRHDDIYAGGVTMYNENLFFSKFKFEISTFLKTGKIPLKLEQSFIKNITMKELFEYKILSGEYIYCKNNFVHKENFDFSIYQNDFDKILLELQNVYIEIFEKYKTDENKLKKYIKNFAIKYSTNEFCILLLNNIDHPIFDELNIMIIDNFNTIEQEEEQENTIYCEDKFILSTNFNWSIYNNDFKLIYSEFEKLFFDLMDKYQTNEEKFKKHLKKFALKYPTNKFCNLLLDNIDKSSFYDLNIIIAEKFTQESNI
jgi:hypothetical protein